MSLPGAFAENPVLMTCIFIIGGGLIYLRSRLLNGAVQSTQKSHTHGLRQSGKATQTRHETGIGTKDVITMKPEPVSAAIWFSLIFFGGGAVFYAFIVLTAPDTQPKDWGTFLALSGFAVMSLAVIEQNFVRFIVHPDRIVRLRPLYRDEVIFFSEIEQITPLRKKIEFGVTLHTQNKQQFRIPARFSGYLDLLDRLGEIDANTRLVARLLRQIVNSSDA